MLGTISVSAHSGNYYSGQQYDYNGFNVCQSQQLANQTNDFIARVVDEYGVIQGTTTANLGYGDVIEVRDAGGPGSKECQIITDSPDHAPGFNARSAQ